MAETASNRIVITVLGKNRPGIVASISRVLGDENVDIRDITQSIIEDIFTMTMIADISAAASDFTTLQERLSEAGESIGVNVQIQREVERTLRQAGRRARARAAAPTARAIG